MFITIVSFSIESHVPFHLHTELAYCMKAALNSLSRADLNVRIDVPFDRYPFIGVLQQARKLTKSTSSHQVFVISKYSALSSLLGEQWHVTVLNKQMDFSYVVRETVRFYLRRHQSIIDPVDSWRSIDGGHMLVFRFVWGDGVQQNWEDITSLD